MSVDISAESNLDAIFTEIGECNILQVVRYILICIPNAVAGMYVMSYIFTANTLEYRCKIPECDLDQDNRLLQYDQPWLPYAVPYASSSKNTSFQNCHRYAPANLKEINGSLQNREECSTNMFDTTKQIKCTEFVYRSSEKNVQTEFNIHCSDSYKLALVGTVNNVGRFVSLGFAGVMADKFGRLTVVVIGMLSCSIFGLLKSFTGDYLSFLMFEFLESTGGTCTFTAIYVLGIEWVSTKYRVLGSSVVSLSFPIGEVCLGLAAMYIQDFRHLMRTLYTPGLLIVAYIWLVPESVRWLLVTGRVDRAINILKKTAATNGRQLSEKSINMLKLRYAPHLITKSAIDNKLSTIEKPSMLHSIRSIIKSKRLLVRFFCGCYCWVTCCYCFYGLSLVSTNIRGENRYMSFINVAVVEIPGVLLAIPLLNRFSRRKLAFITLMITGVTTIITPWVPQDKSVIVLLCFMIGKASISCGFTILYIFTAEIWPTNLRNTMMCSSSMIGRIGGMVAPLTPLLAVYFEMLPYLLFGGSAILAAFLIIFNLPETLNKKLPDTVQEAEYL